MFSAPVPAQIVTASEGISCAQIWCVPAIAIARVLVRG